MKWMKAVLFALIFMVPDIRAAKEVILDKPAGKGVDRIIQLKTIATIDGSQDSRYFLKSPTRPVWFGSNKFLALADNDQLLIFNQKGEFLHNLQKLGEGPGEWQYTIAVIPYDDKLIVFANQPRKCIIFDSDFKFLKEIRFDTMQAMMRPLWATPQGGAFFATELDFAKIKTGTTPFLSILKHYDANGKISTSELKFDYRVYSWVKKDKQSIMVSMTNVEPFHFASLLQKQIALVACRETYRLELIDLKTNQVSQSLIRKVARRTWQQDPDETRAEGAPKPDFFHDISAVIADNDHFWIIGSDIDTRGSVSVDQIGGDGIYLDRFRMVLPGLNHPRKLERSPLAVSGNHIAWIHLDEEDNPVITIFSMEN